VCETNKRKPKPHLALKTDIDDICFQRIIYNRIIFKNDYVLQYLETQNSFNLKVRKNQ